MKPDAIFPSRGVCDFCSGPNPDVTYIVDSFVALELEKHDVKLEAVSVENWSACETCAKFIDAGDWQGLITYVLPLLPIRKTVPAYRLHEFDIEMRKVMTEVYAKLVKHRKMPA